MTNGQAAQLQELSRCYVSRGDSAWLRHFNFSWNSDRKRAEFYEWNKRKLRSLFHKYRHQIKAMKRNRNG